MVTVPLSTKNTRCESWPLMVRFDAPGPLMLTFALIKGSALSKLIVPAAPAPEKPIVCGPLPDAFTDAMAARSEPGPLSLVFVTWKFAAKSELPLGQLSATRRKTLNERSRLVFDINEFHEPVAENKSRRRCR